MLNSLRDEVNFLFSGMGMPYQKVALMVAVVCTVIFTITLGNNTVREAPVAVVDLDNSKYSHELTETINASPFMQVKAVFNTPVILLESKRDYYDIYVSEKQAAHLTEGGTITGTTVATDKKVPGTIRFITQAPGFADLKNSREKGQSDLSSFQIRIYTQPDAGVRPGMTIEVSDAEFTKR